MRGNHRSLQGTGISIWSLSLPQSAAPLESFKEKHIHLARLCTHTHSETDLGALNIRLTSVGCYFLTGHPLQWPGVTLEHVWHALGCSGCFFIVVLCIPMCTGSLSLWTTDTICDKWVAHQTKECRKIMGACEVHEMQRRQACRGWRRGSGGGGRSSALCFWWFCFRAINLVRSLRVPTWQEGRSFWHEMLDFHCHCHVRDSGKSWGHAGEKYWFRLLMWGK